VAVKRSGRRIGVDRFTIDALVCRRSPHLVCYWRKSDFVVENYATGVKVGAQPITADILGFFGDWRAVATLLARNPSQAHDALRALIAELLRHSLLQPVDHKLSNQERAMTLWDSWNPAAGFFHSATRDLHFVDMDTQVRQLKRQSRTAPMPDPVKRYRGAQVIPLSSSDVTSEFPQVVLSRRTWRRFSRVPVDLESFGTLLGLTARVQQWANAKGEGKVALKTSPSGGARHAIELYTLALHVAGLPNGLYHYAADAHALELIERKVSRQLVDRYLPSQPWYRPAAAVVLFSAVFPRELWRYPYARAYRAVLIEAGHLCQTFCLSGTWLGLAPFCSMALADSRIERDLGLDGITESVVYAAGVGTRPHGVDWTPSSAQTSPASHLTRRATQNFPGRITPRR
jgi:SagB-type dehydrogenase family enzyme